TASCPVTFEQSFTEAILYSCIFTSCPSPTNSTYPPRSPHSPTMPLLVEWNDASWKLPYDDDRFFSCSSTFRNDVKGVRSGRYTLAWYTSSAISTRFSDAQNFRISTMLSAFSVLPVGFPGLMTTRARGFRPAARAFLHAARRE